MAQRLSPVREDEENEEVSEEKAQQQQPQKYCDFCGAVIADISNVSSNNSASSSVLVRRKYCSEKCRVTAIRRRTSARLGIPPRRSRVAKLSDPLYFN